MKKKNKILIVADDPKLRKTLCDIFTAKGYAPVTVAKGQTALKKVEKEKPAVALIDLKLKDMCGIEVMKGIKESSHDTDCIIMTGNGTKKAVIEAVNQGAFFYLQKPYEMDQLLVIIQRAIEKREIIEQFQNLIENSLDAIAIIDKDGIFKYLSPSHERIQGSKPEELLGTSYVNLVHPEDLENISDSLNDFANKRKVTDRLIFRSRHKDGSWRTMEAITQNLLEDPKTMGIVANYRDITERKLSEEALRESEEKYRLLADNTQDVIWTMNTQLEFEYVNPAIYAMTGFTPEEWIGSHLSDHVDEEHFAQMSGLAAEEIAKGSKGTGVIFESVMLKKDGTPFDVEINATLIFYNQGDFIGMQGVTRDITERKRAEKALRGSEEKYRSLFENSIEAIFTTDIKGNITSANKAVEILLGYDREKLIGLNYKKYTKPEMGKEIFKAYNRLYITGEPIEKIIYNIIRKNGEVRTIEGYVNVIREGNEVIGFQGSWTDITEKRRAEEDLRESEEMYRNLVSNLTDVVMEIDSQGKFAYVSPHIFDILGYTPEESVGLDALDFIHPDDLENCLKAMTTMTKVKNIEYRSRHKDGHYIAVSTSGKFVPDGYGGTKMISIARDITERKQAEEALQHSKHELDIRNKILGKFLTFEDDDVYEEILSLVLDVLESKYGIFGYIDENGDLVCPSLTREIWNKCQIPDKNIVFPREEWGGIWCRALTEKKTTYSNEPFRVPEGHIPIHRALDVPVVYGGKVIGNFLIGNKETDYDEKDRKLLETIADHVAPIMCARFERNRQEKERKQAEKALITSEEKHRAIIENIDDGYFEVDIAGNFSFFNESMCRILGYSTDEMIGLNYRKYMDEETAKDAYKKFNEVFRKKEVMRTLDWELIRKNRDRVTVSTTISPMLDTEENVIGFRGIARDITEKKRAEEALNASEIQYRRLFEAAKDGILILDADTGKIVDVNPFLTSLLGYSHEELLGRELWEIGVFKDIISNKEKFLQLQQGGYVRYEDLPLQTRNGTEISVEFISNVYLVNHSNVVQCNIRDITERKKFLKERDLTIKVLSSFNSIYDIPELLKSLISVLHEWSGFEAVGIRYRDGLDYPYFETRGFPGEFVEAERFLCVLDDTGNPVLKEDGNPVLECMCGNVIQGRYDPSKPFFTKNGSFWSNSTTELLASTTEEDRQARTRNRCNGEGYESVALIPLRHVGETFGLIQFNDTRKDCFTPDLISVLERTAGNISMSLAQRLSDVKIKESEEKWRTLFESSRDVIYLSTIEGKFLDINKEGENLFGFTLDELLDMDVKDIYQNPEDREMLINSITANGFVKDYELAFKRKDETPIDCLVTANIKKDSNSSATIHGIIRDLSEIKKMQQKLVQTEKLSSLGGILSGVAHELNNPLTAIIGFSELLARTDLPEDAIDKLNLIVEQSKRSAKIVKSLLTFAREHKPERRMMDVNTVIKDSFNLREYELRTNNISFRLDLGENLPETLADPYQLEQVFVNLINNAYQAMKERGEGSLIIRSFQEDKKIVIHFVDDGPGIPSEYITRIFDPFFTTKEVGQGTGLGLSIVYGIIEEHGGDVNVDSKLGKGTTFTIELPIIEGKETPVGDKTKMPKKPYKSYSILVVEDEESLRKFISDVLIQEGYDVKTSRNGEEAIEMLDSDEFDAVISDIKMPGMSGQNLYTYIQKYHKELVDKVLFITGDVLGSNTQYFFEITKCKYLSKPFEIDDLFLILNELLHPPKTEK